VIGPSQRPLHDDKQHSQKTDIYVPAGFEPKIAASKRPQTHIIFTSLLSLGGLPPFIGFLSKRIFIQAIITNNMAPLATIVVVTLLVTLHYYLKISYSRFIILNTEPK
jgi:NADH:ubiquinone oxidoreductase subunit 2 (subunit N)